MTADGSLDGTLLESEVGILRKRAILKDEILAVTEGLCARDMTADEAKIPGIPAEVLAVDFRVVDGAVLALPKSVLGIKNGIVDFNVVSVLESVFADQP